MRAGSMKLPTRCWKNFALVASPPTRLLSLLPRSPAEPATLPTTGYMAAQACTTPTMGADTLRNWRISCAHRARKTSGASSTIQRSAPQQATRSMCGAFSRSKPWSATIRVVHHSVFFRTQCLAERSATQKPRRVALRSRSAMAARNWAFGIRAKCERPPSDCAFNAVMTKTVCEFFNPGENPSRSRRNPRKYWITRGCLFPECDKERSNFRGALCSARRPMSPIAQKSSPTACSFPMRSLKRKEGCHARACIVFCLAYNRFDAGRSG